MLKNVAVITTKLVRLQSYLSVYFISNDTHEITVTLFPVEMSKKPTMSFCNSNIEACISTLLLLL